MMNSLQPLPQLSPSSLKALADRLEREAQRRRAKTSLLDYVQSIDIPGVPDASIDEDRDADGLFYGIAPKALGAHHLYWIARLQDVADGKVKRLMGLMPPGTAKSTYTSVVFPTFCMGRKPGFNFIGASYGSDLIRKFGRRARTIVKSAAFSAVMDTGISSESSAADEWELVNGSTYMGGGILSGITGNRADGVAWDDLIKGREQADSETIRSKTWDAYFDDLLTRKKPGAWEVGITTRWHEDDVAGRILPENYSGETGLVSCRDGNDWFVVCFPAVSERADDPLGRAIGERIWPEWFPEDHFEPFKRSPRTWSALYQQRPAPDEGAFFQRDWIKTYDSLPPDVHFYGASDYAVTADGGDWTVHIVGAVDSAGNLYIVDVWRGQTTADVWIDAFLGLVGQYGPLNWAEEQGQIIKSVGPFIDRRMDETRTYCAREQFTSIADKPTRARAIQARMATGKVLFKANASWLADLQSEMLTFPAGKHDDQVDALSLLGRLMAEMIGRGIEDSGSANADRWDKAFDAQDDAGVEEWKVL